MLNEFLFNIHFIYIYIASNANEDFFDILQTLNVKVITFVDLGAQIDIMQIENYNNGGIEQKEEFYVLNVEIRQFGTEFLSPPFNEMLLEVNKQDKREQNSL